MGPSTGPGGLSVHGEAEGGDEGPVGHARPWRGGASTERAAGIDLPDQGAESLRDEELERDDFSSKSHHALSCSSAISSENRNPLLRSPWGSESRSGAPVRATGFKL